MSRSRAAVGFEHRSGRNGARFSGRYAATGPDAPAAAGTLEHFLTERYCLYAENKGRLYRAEIHHPPWPLQPAEAEISENTMAPAGVELPSAEPLLHYARRQDVVVWRPNPV